MVNFGWDHITEASYRTKVHHFFTLYVEGHVVDNAIFPLDRYLDPFHKIFMISLQLSNIAPMHWSRPKQIICQNAKKINRPI